LSFGDELARLSRRPAWMLVIYPDYCANQFGVSPCAAAGTPCYFTYPTCRDRAHYSKSAKEYRFCEQSGAWLKDALPYIKSLQYNSMELDPKTFKTTRANLTVTLVDDAPHCFANPDKLDSNLESAGSFWKNWLARNPNYFRRRAELYLCFDAEERRLYFRGGMEKFELKPGEAVLAIKDLLKSLDAESHSKQSDKVALAYAYAGGGQLYLYYGNELPASGIIQSCEAGSGGKYVKYSGLSGPDSLGVWTLSNASFCFGSGGTINAGDAVKQRLVYGRDNYGLANGLTADMIMLDLLCTRAGVGPEFIAVVDSGAALATGISNSNAGIPISDGSLAPDQGVIKIDNEFIIYGSKTGNILNVGGNPSIPIFYGHERGAFGSASSAHDAGAKVQLPTITREGLAWLNNNLFRANISDPVKIQDLFNQICEQSLVQAWQNESGQIEFRQIAPPSPDSVVQTLADKDSIIEDSLQIIDDPDLQNTRVLIFYNPLEANPGNDPAKYQDLLMETDAAIEDAAYLNAQKPKTIYANWIYRSDEAAALAGRLLALTRAGALQAKFKVELKDSGIEIGRFVKLDSKQVVDETGANQTGYFEIISKKPASAGKFSLAALRFGFEGLFGMIGPENPPLKNAIDAQAAVIDLQLRAGAFLNEHFAESGQIEIGDEKISYVSKSYNAVTQVLTLNGCGRGILGTSRAAHSAGAAVRPLYNGASQAASNRWAWISDAANKLDADGDGVNETQGYVIW
jgi:hypothetical protein